jgi:hypothetical protein
MKKYLFFAIILLTNIVSCSQALNTSESLSLFALLSYRQNVTIGGSFFGNYNADVKTVALSTDGKCDTSASGLGAGVSDDSGGFKVSYPRISPSGGYVCVIATPKADGSSRFFAVDQQKEFAWTGTAYSILVLPEPSTTSRSQFNVVSTMFNRMATQKLEKLAEGNKDLSRAGTLLKSANKQIVSQFGLSRGLSKNVRSSKLSLKEALNRVLYSEPRASSLESATPDLNNIVIDFSKKDDPVTLKFTVIIGGIQSLADPNDPSSYDKVVGLISNVIASGNSTSSVVFPGGATLSAGGSFGALVSAKIQTFVQSQGAALGLSESEINNIKIEAVQLATAIDKPPVSATPVPTVIVEKPLYSLSTNTFKIGESFSISPQITGTTNLQITEVCTSFCQAVSGLSLSNSSLTLSSTSLSTESSLTLSPGVNNNSSVLPGNIPSWLQFSGTTGVIAGTVPENLPGDASFQLRISGIRYGATITGTVNFTLRGKPTLSFSNSLSYLTSIGLQQISIGPLPPNYEISYTPTIVGANSTLTVSGLPTEGCISFNSNNGAISGNFSCISTETSAQVTVSNDIGSSIYSIKFIPNFQPTVSSVSISGILLYPNTLTPNYNFLDLNNNAEGNSTYIWYRCATAQGTCDAISSANNKTYTIQSDDVGKYLKVQITPVDNLGLAGVAAMSTAVLVENRAPSISSVSINNTESIYVGAILNGFYGGYSDLDNNSEGTPLYSWLRCETEVASTCPTITEANLNSYTVQTADVGKFIKLQVTPVDNLGSNGTPILSSAKNVINRAPSIASVFISNPSSNIVGNIIQGAYSSYFDADGSPMGIFQYSWYRCDSEGLSCNSLGVNLSSYTIQSADAGKLIKLQVIPVDNLGAVGSSLSASLLISNLQPPAQCLSYTSITGSDRHIGLGSGSNCDTTAGAWVRFDGNYTMIPSTVVTPNSCSTSATGYLTSDHPVNLFQQLSGTVCYNWSDNKCSWTNQISITKCDGYYVYQLPTPPTCTLRYCTTTPYSFATISNPSSNSVGNTLQGSFGELTISQNTPQYNWLRCDSSAGTSCVTINGASSSSYTITTADSGKFIQFQATPLNATPVKSQLVQVFNPSQNLVLFLPFDEAPTNGNNLDKAPSFNSEISATSPIFTAFDANRSNPTATSDRRGVANSAYYFNGNAYVAVSNNSKINLSSNMTTSVWIKVATLNTNTGQYSGIVSKWNSNALGGYIMRLSGDKIQNDNVNGSAIALNTWYHIVNTISSSKVPKIYINGVLNATGSALQNFNGNSDNVNIGVDYYTMEGMTRSFTGSIDEVRIYNKELTADEIKSLYEYERAK